MFGSADFVDQGFQPPSVASFGRSADITSPDHSADPSSLSAISSCCWSKSSCKKRREHSCCWRLGVWIWSYPRSQAYYLCHLIFKVDLFESVSRSYACSPTKSGVRWFFFQQECRWKEASQKKGDIKKIQERYQKEERRWCDDWRWEGWCRTCAAGRWVGWWWWWRWSNSVWCWIKCSPRSSTSKVCQKTGSQQKSGEKTKFEAHKEERRRRGLSGFASNI